MSKKTTMWSGFYCPIPTKPIRERWLRTGKYLLDESSLEKRCPHCEEYWPVDTEFWNLDARYPDGLHVRCKACYAEWRHSQRKEVA